MKLRISQRRTMIVIGVFAGCIALAWFASHLISGTPTPRAACTKKCAEAGKEGRLVYSGPATPRDVYKDANSVCECR
jgi:hypothetical protein